MNRFVKTLFPLLAAVLLFTAGCAPAGDAAQGDQATEMTVFDCGGLRAGIPTQYLDQLIVKTDLPEDGTHGPILLSVWEKASVEAYQADQGIDSTDTPYGPGFLFGINVIGQAAYEQYLCADNSYTQLFATDGERYYIDSYGTQETFYRSGGSDMESEDWKNWEALWALGGQVCRDFVDRNGLTPYGEEAFWERAFTYDGNHAYVKYYPYFTFDGDKRMWDTLVLSQPVRQGDGGIWCVERMYDENGNVYPWFPDTGMASADYYAERQAACDAGTDTALLTPLGAAREYVEQGFYGRETQPESFALTDGVDTAYMETNRRAGELAVTLLNGREVDGMELLVCMGAFTPDNWGVLGRSHYGSDWWPPLRSALEQAAVGGEQEVRDRNMMRLYLSSHGQFEEAVAGFLQAQRSAGPEVFDAVLSEFSGEDQARLWEAL